jgi:hypothetical protein
MDSPDDLPTIPPLAAIDGLGAILLGCPSTPPEVRSAVAAVCAAALPCPVTPVPHTGPWAGPWRSWLRYAAHFDAVDGPRGRALAMAVAWAVELDTRGVA